MLLFCGIPSEPPLALAIAAAERTRAPFLVVNQRHSHLLELDIAIDGGGMSGTLRVAGAAYELSSFTGIYARLMEVEVLPELQPRGRSAPDQTIMQSACAFNEALAQWIELADCTVFNRAGAMASNASKPYQLQLIRDCGFSVPSTLITNDQSEARSFLAHHKRVIYKSTSSIRSIVRELSSTQLDEPSRLRHLPTQFQAMIPGDDVRVHVVGKEIFATEIRTVGLDYRYASRDGHAVSMRASELPKKTAVKCIDLARALRLGFCGIDFKRTASGELFCLEVNPSPAYSFYEEQTAQPIARAIVAHLSPTQERARNGFHGRKLGRHTRPRARRTTGGRPVDTSSRRDRSRQHLAG